MELGKCGNGKVLKALGICILAYFHIFTFAHCAEGATFDMLSCCPGEDNATQARFVWHSDSDDSSYPSRTPVSWTLSASAAASSPSVGWVTACDDDQTSLEVNKRGKFTKPFVAAWKDDATDANGDGHNPA